MKLGSYRDICNITPLFCIHHDKSRDRSQFTICQRLYNCSLLFLVNCFDKDLMNVEENDYLVRKLTSCLGNAYLETCVLTVGFEIQKHYDLNNFLISFVVFSSYCIALHSFISILAK